MLGVTRRMIYSLALIPIVPAAAFVARDCCLSYLLPVGSDEYRWFDLFFSSLMVLGIILIWRAAILWTLGRKMLTALVGMIPFVQVIYAQPWWDAGCVLRDILRAGQEQFGVAIWMWVLIWAWWGYERLTDSGKTRPSRPWRMRMNPRLRTVVASIGTLPFVVAMCLILAATYDSLLGVRDPWLIPATFLSTAVLAVAAWLLIWRKSVQWTGWIIGRTLLAAGILIGVPAMITVLCEKNPTNPLWTILMALPAIGWGIWMALTMWLWPFTASGIEIGETSPRCLKCGYLLNGLKHTRCPECGDERTLDELWAANAAQA